MTDFPLTKSLGLEVLSPRNFLGQYVYAKDLEQLLAQAVRVWSDNAHGWRENESANSAKTALLVGITPAKTIKQMLAEADRIIAFAKATLAKEEK